MVEKPLYRVSGVFFASVDRAKLPRCCQEPLNELPPCVARSTLLPVSASTSAPQGMFTVARKEARLAHVNKPASLFINMRSGCL